MIKINVVRVEQTATIFTVSVGWIFVLHQAWHGDNPGNGTVWLAGFAMVATVGAAVTLIARRNQHALRTLGLLVAVLSPTVFAYPLNIGLALAACAEFVVFAMAMRRTPSPPSTG
jgi:hypothetical protein